MLLCKKKQALTLLEIMIVIFLIGLIGSVIGYNMKGSLEEGKAFKTEKAIEQIHDILMLEVAQGEPIEKVVKNPEGYLSHANVVKNPEKLLKDGWGVPFKIEADQYGHDIVVSSDAYQHYKERKKAKLNKNGS